MWMNDLVGRGLDEFFDLCLVDFVKWIQRRGMLVFCNFSLEISGHSRLLLKYILRTDQMELLEGSWIESRPRPCESMKLFSTYKLIPSTQNSTNVNSLVAFVEFRYYLLKKKNISRQRVIFPWESNPVKLEITNHFLYYSFIGVMVLQEELQCSERRKKMGLNFCEILAPSTSPQTPSPTKKLHPPPKKQQKSPFQNDKLLILMLFHT